MANFICEAHFWSYNYDSNLLENTTAYNKLYAKNYTKTTYTEEKIAYNESRNVLCKPENKLIGKFARKIQEIDEILREAQVIRIQWISRNLVEIIFMTGVILSITINQFTGDILHRHKDSVIASYFGPSRKFCDALLSETCFIASCDNENKLFMLTFSSPRFDPSKVQLLDDTIFRKDEKPEINEIKIKKGGLECLFDGPNANVQKHLLFNYSKNHVILWFAYQKDNLFIFSVGRDSLKLMYSISTSGVPLGIQFSLLDAEMILSVESSSSTAINGYKFQGEQISLAYSTQIPTENQVVCCDWSRDENKVAFATDNKELFAFCASMKVTRSVGLSFDPVRVRWMANNCCIVVFGKSGEMQFYDVALNHLKLLISGSIEDIFQVFLGSAGPSDEIVAMDTNMCFDRMTFGLMDVNECFLLSTKSGPITMVTVSLGTSNNVRGLTSSSIFNQYLHSRRIIEAHELLQSLDWSFEASNCFYCLTAFVNHLFRMPPDNDVINYIQSALGKFYSFNGSPIVALEYGESVTNLSRRHFKLLMRLKMFEKCYLIACDIQHKDLFMELYYAARNHGETALAESSRRAAVELEEETLECEFQPDDRDSILSLDSLDSMYSSPRISEEEDDIEEGVEVNNREIITQLVRDTENLMMNDLNDEFTQFIK